MRLFEIELRGNSDIAINELNGSLETIMTNVLPEYSKIGLNYNSGNIIAGNIEIVLDELKYVVTPFRTYENGVDFSTVSELFALLDNRVLNPEFLSDNELINTSLGLDAFKSSLFLSARSVSRGTTDDPVSVSNIGTILVAKKTDNNAVVTTLNAADYGKECYIKWVKADYTTAELTFTLSATPQPISDVVVVNDFRLTTATNIGNIEVSYVTGGAIIARIGTFTYGSVTFPQSSFRNMMRMIPKGERWVFRSFFNSVINDLGTDIKGVDIVIRLWKANSTGFSLRTPIPVKLDNFNYDYSTFPVMLEAGDIFDVVYLKSYANTNVLTTGLEVSIYKTGE